jgi:ubiquinone/menaquinone biosynthesis C-methylase UbiE
MVSAILLRRDIEISNTTSAASTSIWQRLEAKVLDAHTLSGISDDSISHITGTMVYNLVADGRKALEAAHRVLVPGGVIGVTLGSGGEWIEIVRLPLTQIPRSLPSLNLNF